ncbi:MAG: hypothetical protein WEC99_06520 [Halofilum sp. (in: g-proteobacteria)]
MRKGLGIVAVAGMVVSLTGALADDTDLRRWVHGHVTPARAAYQELAAHPGDAASFERAARLIQRARQRDPHGARVYIALAQASLASGYRQGGRFRANAYAPGALERAQRFAERALARGPEQSLTYATLGYIALIEGQPRAARYWVERAERLDPDGFQPRLLQSVLHRRVGERAQAEAVLAMAARRVERPHQAAMLRAARQASADARTSEEGKAANGERRAPRRE